jgi:hypothetical protein
MWRGRCVASRVEDGPDTGVFRHGDVFRAWCDVYVPRKHPVKRAHSCSRPLLLTQRSTCPEPRVSTNPCHWARPTDEGDICQTFPPSLPRTLRSSASTRNSSPLLWIPRCGPNNRPTAHLRSPRRKRKVLWKSSTKYAHPLVATSCTRAKRFKPSKRLGRVFRHSQPEFEEQVF